MATELKVYGPFEIEFNSHGIAKHIAKEHIAAFWDNPEAAAMKSKQGCYVFALKSGRGFKPWYVGKAGKGFKQEIFTDSKLRHYSGPLFKDIKGKPVMFFVAPSENKRKVPKAELDHMEKELIQYAACRNPALCNVQSKNGPQWSIKGVIRPGRGRLNDNEKQFKTMMKITSS